MRESFDSPPSNLVDSNVLVKVFSSPEPRVTLAELRFLDVEHQYLTGLQQFTTGKFIP